MSDKNILTMRAMAWQRAKGELLSILETYWPEWDSVGKKRENGFDLASQKINAFIRNFEEDCR